MVIIREQQTERFDAYFNHMQKLMEERKYPLQQWNLIQKHIWLELVRNNYVSRNDVKAFYAFGEFFNAYYKKTGRIADYARVVAHINGDL